ncbi:unnamed protein product [Soboliphyme baturini]|uniref:ZP domain-containing protein n=1 Tax=Soboliphyme baturini TaxID=241478 RepID=A0A183I927_9BILA|nr:unnamed protein product [Soboliphyme baturini]
MSCLLCLFAIRVSSVTNSSGNRLIGIPTVDCRSSDVRISFTTEKPFVSRVYVKGRSADRQCSRNFVKNLDQTQVTMLIGQNECGMKENTFKTRSDSDGVTLTITIVISFHGTFEIHADHGFEVLCSIPRRRRVKSQLDVKPLKAIEINGTSKLPECTYVIHRHSENGEVIRYAEIGTKVAHPPPSRVQLLDSRGCAADPLIQTNVHYSSELNRAYAESWAYRFSDTAELKFQCELELCRRSIGECDEVTPPRCTRFKRLLRSNMAAKAAGEDERPPEKIYLSLRS